MGREKEGEDEGKRMINVGGDDSQQSWKMLKGPEAPPERNNPAHNQERRRGKTLFFCAKKERETCEKDE